MGVLMFLVDPYFISKVDWSQPVLVMAYRNVFVAAQVVLSAAAIYGVWRTDVHRFAMSLVVASDVLIGLGFTVAGWIRFDELFKDLGALPS